MQTRKRNGGRSLTRWRKMRVICHFACRRIMDSFRYLFPSNTPAAGLVAIVIAVRFGLVVASRYDTIVHAYVRLERTALPTICWRVRRTVQLDAGFKIELVGTIDFARRQDLVIAAGFLRYQSLVATVALSRHRNLGRTPIFIFRARRQAF